MKKCRICIQQFCRNTGLFILIYLISLSDIEAQQSSGWQNYREAEILQHSEPVVEWSKYHDEDTGYEVWQMTSNDSGAWATHFNTQSFTPDDQYLVFSSERTGNWQLFRVDLENGEIRQLTNVNSLNNASFTVHPNGEEVYFGFDGKLGRVNIHTGEIYHADFDVPVIFRRLISNDGRYTVVSSIDENSSTILLLSLPDVEIEAKLHWKGGTTLSLGVEWTGGISHTMLNPAYPWLVTFLPRSTHREETPYFDHQRDMSLPMKLRARVWIWDARTGEARPFLSMPYHYSNTHEAWGWDGERFFFFQKHAPGWVPNHIASVNKEGMDWQNHHSDDTLRLGHGSPSYDGEWFISDGQDPDRNPLRLINLETGQWKDLCWPDASISPGHAEQAHVHPSFSSSGNYVTYTSDKTGSPEVYVIPISQDVKDKLSK